MKRNARLSVRITNILLSAIILFLHFSPEIKTYQLLPIFAASFVFPAVPRTSYPAHSSASFLLTSKLWMSYKNSIGNFSKRPRFGTTGSTGTTYYPTTSAGGRTESSFYTKTSTRLSMTSSIANVTSQPPTATDADADADANNSKALSRSTKVDPKRTNWNHVNNSFEQKTNKCLDSDIGWNGNLNITSSDVLLKFTSLIMHQLDHDPDEQGGNYDNSEQSLLEGSTTLSQIEKASELLQELTIRARMHIGTEAHVDCKKSDNQQSEHERKNENTKNTQHGDCSKTLKAQNDLVQNAICAAQALRDLMSHYGPAKGKGRKALLSAISIVSLDADSLVQRKENQGRSEGEDKLLAVVCVVTALALREDVENTADAENHNRGSNLELEQEEEHRSISRAAVSGLLPNGRYQNRRKEENNEKKQLKGKMDEYESDDLNNYGTDLANLFGWHAVQVLLDVRIASAATESPQQHQGTTPGNQQLSHSPEIRSSTRRSSFKMTVDLHIVTTLARAFVTHQTTTLLAPTCAAVLRQTLQIEEHTNTDDTINGIVTNTSTPNSNPKTIPKIDATSALGLAAQLAPWKSISPLPLLHIAMDLHLWHASERICHSTIRHNCNRPSYRIKEAVEALIDGTSERHMYRQSDALATEFYDYGGRSRYAEARFLHACETIAKVVAKRQYPILERQVERVDKAFKRVRDDRASLISSGCKDVHDDYGFLEDQKELEQTERNGPEEVREFSLMRLREINEHATAHRLATLWNMEYWYNEEDAEKHIQARLERYIQFKDAFAQIDTGASGSCNIPEILSSPCDLVNEFEELIATVNEVSPVIGFDAEWGDDCVGASLLQLSTTRKAILIDVPALLASVEGCDSLEQTVGCLFAGSMTASSVRPTVPVVMAGFSCREDMSRLRASVGVRSKHWLGKTEAFVDIKPLVAMDVPNLKHLGLSRICNHYFGKPLDKAEQCSLWARRPLSIHQRAYAALDAWVVAAVWEKLPSHITKGKRKTS